jgi:hypothetical protein
MRTPIKKLLVISLAALGMPLGLMIVPNAAPAALAATAACTDAPSNANCNGVSPGQLGSYEAACTNDAERVASGYYVDPNREVNYSIHLYYSPHCHTNWARVDAFVNLPAGRNTLFPIEIRRYAGRDGGYLMYHAGAVSTYMYGWWVDSPMVYAPSNKAQACLSLPPFTGNDDQIYCTAAM